MLKRFKIEVFYIQKLIKFSFNPLIWLRYARHRFFGASAIRLIIPLRYMVDKNFELHVLTQKSGVVISLWAVCSFLHHSKLRPQVVIHEDGSLDYESIQLIKDILPDAKVILRADADYEIFNHPRVSERTKKFRKSSNNLILKFIDMVVLSKAKKVMILDNDVLFYKRPKEIVDFVHNDTLNHGLITKQNGVFDVIMDKKYVEKHSIDHEVTDYVNSGIILFDRKSITIDAMNEYFDHTKLERENHVIEMAGWACLLFNAGFEFLPIDTYKIKAGINKDTIAKHYTSARRHEMYAYGIDRVISDLKRIKIARLTYVFNGRLPTQKAHGLTIIKSCEAFANNGMHTKLVVAKRHNELKENIFSYYKVPQVFDVSKVWAVSLSNFTNRFGYYVQALTSSLGILWRILNDGDKSRNMFYARDYPSLSLLSFLPYRYVAEIHDYRSSKSRWWMNRILKRAERVITNSVGTRDALLAHYDIDSDKILSISNGVDPGFFEIESSKNEIRTQLGIPRDKIIFAFVGSLSMLGKAKGVDDVLDAFDSLEDKSNSLLYIVGGPDNAVDKYRRQGNASGVNFTGHVPYTDIPKYLKAVDVVLIPVPSNAHASTTSPIKLFEFMAAGKVIIAPDIPAMCPPLNNQRAILFDPQRDSSLSQQMRVALDTHDKWSKLQNNVREASLKYTWNRRAKRILNFINT